MYIEVTFGLIKREYDMDEKPNEGDKIEIQLPFAIKGDPWRHGVVCCLLATQFTATVDEHGKEFFFYKHYGNTWRYKK